jgi:shikimate kinase
MSMAGNSGRGLAGAYARGRAVVREQNREAEQSTKTQNPITREAPSTSQVLREVFYTRLPIGETVADYIFRTNEPLFNRVAEALGEKEGA